MLSTDTAADFPIHFGGGLVTSPADADFVPYYPASNPPPSYAKASGHHAGITAQAQQPSLHTFQAGAQQQELQARPQVRVQTFWMTYLNALDGQTARSILSAVIDQSPLVQGLVYRHGCAATYAKEERERREKQRVVSFDSHSGDAWYILNKKYSSSSSSSSKEYDHAFDAQEEVADSIRTIHKQASGECSFGTKKSAMETLRKMGKSIALAPSTLGSEVRKHFSHDPCQGC